MSVRIPGHIGNCSHCGKGMPDDAKANTKYCKQRCAREAQKLRRPPVTKRTGLSTVGAHE